MKVTLERLPESRVSLDIEVDPERVEQKLDVAYKRLASSVRVPGFRPGKAPRPMIERQIGRQRLMSEALDLLVPEVYNEALETEDVDAIAQPELESVDIDPVRLKFTVPIRPTIDLGDYHSIRVEREPVDVTDEMVDEQVQMLRRRFATQVPVDRAIDWGDVIIADVTGEVEGEQFLEDENAEFPLEKDVTLLVDGLAEAFVGLKKGEEKTIDLTLPEDFRAERLAGKTATFKLTIREVKENQLPEADDELANQVGSEEFPTFDALITRIRENLQEQLQRDADSAHHAKVVDTLVEGATIEYPRVLVEHEIDHIINETMGGDAQAYAAYLQRVGRNEQDYRESLREAAETRVKRSLVLSRVAEAEGIEVSEDEIEAEIASIAEPMGDDAERFKELFSTDDGKATIRRNLLNKKLLDRISAIAAGELKEEPA